LLRDSLHDTALAQPNPVLDTPGVFSVARNLSLTSTSIFQLDIDHGVGASPLAGTDYDQVVVGTGTGTVSTVQWFWVVAIWFLRSVPM
jgi:hypothetical protein